MYLGQLALRLEPYYLACSYCEHLVAVIQASLGVGAWMEDFVAISSEVVHLVLYIETKAQAYN